MSLGDWGATRLRLFRPGADAEGVGVGGALYRPGDDAETIGRRAVALVAAWRQLRGRASTTSS